MITATVEQEQSGSSIRRVALASFIGTVIEWYDFFLYGTAAAFVFQEMFFPKFDPWTGRLLTIASYAVGFGARPIGGIVCGHYGDRVGRKSMLVLTLIMIGLATAAIGALPTYATIGIFAPLLLVVLRLVQGFGVGGEWGGAVLMAVEHAPKNRRGFYGSWPQMGVPGGLVIATTVFLATRSLMSAESFHNWGWRITFLLSLLLVGVGLYIRLAVIESPAFKQVKESGTESRLPVLDAIRMHPKNVVLAMGARLLENGAFYFMTVFVPTYGKALKIPDSQLLIATLVAAIVEFAMIPVFGALSDRVGRRPLYLFGAIFTGLFAFPFFWMMNTKNIVWIGIGQILALAVGHAAMYAPQASFFSELFGAKVRYSGASLGYQLSSVFAGGVAPLLAIYLAGPEMNYKPVALMIVVMAVITIAAVYFTSETAHRDLESAATPDDASATGPSSQRAPTHPLHALPPGTQL